MTKKILILGKSGQLGTELQAAFLDSSRYDVCAPDEKDADISVYPKLEKIVDQFKPDIIVNCAAATNVDACEKNSATAFLINAYGAENCAKAALKSNAFLIHVSTDYVYDGLTGIEKVSYSTHQDHEKPLNVYGTSKLLGERLIQSKMTPANSNGYLILRTCGLYSVFGKNNFLLKMERLLSDNAALKLICDQWYCPTSARQLARQIKVYIDLDDLDREYILTSLGNVLNASNLGFTSPYLFLSEYLIMRKKPNLLDYIEQISFNDYFSGRDTAKRPLSVRLENEVAKKFDSDVNAFTTIEEALEDFADGVNNSII